MRAWHRRRVGLALVLLGSIAKAHAGNSSPGPAPSPPGPADWSGVYVGAQGGMAWADTGWTFPVDSYFTLLNGKRSFSSNPSSGFMGGHVTWNHQIGAVVVGAELAINGGSLHQERVGTFTSLFPNDRFDTSIDAFGTLTGRFGYAFDDVLLYASGGYARGNARFRAVSGPPGAGVIGDVKQHLNGFVVGGGLEYLLVQNVVIGIEYDFIKLGGATTQIATTGTPSTDPFILSTHDVDMHAVSARLSLKLDQPAAP